MLVTLSNLNVALHELQSAIPRTNSRFSTLVPAICNKGEWALRRTQELSIIYEEFCSQNVETLVDRIALVTAYQRFIMETECLRRDKERDLEESYIVGLVKFQASQVMVHTANRGSHSNHFEES